MKRQPRGIPTLTYCRVLPPTSIGTGDVLIDGNSLTILETGKPSSRHEVAHLLDKSLTDEDVCETIMGIKAGANTGAALNPVAAFVNDAATTVFLLTGSKQTNKGQYLKKTVLPFIANELFVHVAEREQQAVGGFYKAQIDVSAFEIQNEVVIDLLRPANRGLSTVFTIEEGVVMQGIHKESISDERSLRRLFVDACDNRATVSLPPGGSIETSTAIFEIVLYQSESTPPPPSSSNSLISDGAYPTCQSRFLVVDLPSSDPLATGGTVDIRRWEGVTMHKSLLIFQEVVHRLSNPNKARIAPFRSSALTHYLSELLGGNAIVVALGILSQGEPTVSLKTIDLLSALNNAVHYPVGGKEVTDVLQGLLSKYRNLVVQMHDELSLKDAKRIEDMEQGHHLESQVISLQTELAKAVMEKTEAMEDRQHLFEMAELLKEKYATVMAEKRAQSQDLVTVQEDKLALAQELMEGRLDWTRWKEEAEVEKFELNKELLLAKDQIFEMDGKIAEGREDIETLKSELQQKELKMGELKEEIMALNGSMEARRGEVDLEKAKNVELGAELLTLLNAKEVLEERLRTVFRGDGEVHEELEKVQGLLRESERRSEGLERKLLESEQMVLEVRKANADLDLSVRSLELKQEEMKRELSLMLANKGEGVASKPERDQSNGLVTSPPLPVSRPKEESVDKKATSQIRDLEKLLRRSQSDLEEVRTEKAFVDKELKAVLEKYRHALNVGIAQSYSDSETLSHGLHGGTETDKVQGKNKQLSVLSSKSKIHPMELQQQLIDSYSDRERVVLGLLDNAFQQKANMKAVYRQLYDQYRDLVRVIEEHLPTVHQSEVLQECLSFAQESLAKAEVFLDDVEMKEREGIRDRIHQSELLAMQESERMSFVLSTYQRNLEATERQLSASHQENVDLKIQINQLIRDQQQHLQHPSHSDALLSVPPDKTTGPSGGVVPPSGPAGPLLSKEFEQKYYSMYETLTKQISELQRQLPPGDRVKSETVGPVRFPPIAEATKKYPGGGCNGIDSRRGSRNQEPIEAFGRGGGGGGGGTEEGLTSDSMKEYIKNLESNASAAMSNQLRIAENRASDLVAKNSSLQEELKSYQEHMKSVVPQYKKQIQYLKNQVATLSRNNKNQASAETKQTEVADVPKINDK